MPLVTAAAVAVAGFFIYQRIEVSLHRLLGDQLRTILSADVEALRLWVEQQRVDAENATHDGRIRQAMAELATLSAEGASADELLVSPPQSQLRSLLAPDLDQRRIDYVVLSPRGEIVAAYLTEQIGSDALARLLFVRKALAGDAVVSAPFPSHIGLPDDDGVGDVGAPTMFSAAPIRGDRGEVLGVLAFRIRPEADFTRILRLARMGRSGETYAFDRDGRMVSDSRFEPQLRRIGLLPPNGDETSSFNVHIRDPGVNLVGRRKPAPKNPESWPLTRMAKDAIAGNTGYDTAGYADYRGVPVVGAWTWVPELEIGVATEVDVAEAYRPLLVVRNSFRLLIGLTLVIAAANIFVARRAARLERRIEEAEHLGQYELERKIGEGGMGAVYLARHALLQRPTAVKVLSREASGPESLERFEREVQVTAGLSHPNTIAIYDFGHTPEGVFYYAMEFLEGVTLDRCIEVAGPFDEARLIYVLKQACGSLAEAHRAGLLHRDIKPANMILGERGGVYDFLKVLDFGLVRPIEHTGEVGLTNVNSLTGTPLFLSPELIEAPEEVDARSDVYQLGAVAYYMLTGAHVFEGANIFEVCAHHLYAEPETPEQRVGRDFSQNLSALVMSCLAKDRDQRPADAGELLEALRTLQAEGGWSQGEARAWWDRWSDDLHAAPPGARTLPGESVGTNPPEVRIDLGARVGKNP